MSINLLRRKFAAICRKKLSFSPFWPTTQLQSDAQFDLIVNWANVCTLSPWRRRFFLSVCICMSTLSASLVYSVYTVHVLDEVERKLRSLFTKPRSVLQSHFLQRTLLLQTWRTPAVAVTICAERYAHVLCRCRVVIIITVRGSQGRLQYIKLAQEKIRKSFFGENWYLWHTAP